MHHLASPVMSQCLYHKQCPAYAKSFLVPLQKKDSRKEYDV